jgi:hypothetical protein
MDSRLIPAAPAPPGVHTNFNNADNYRHDNIILHTVVLALTTLALCIRVYTRAVIKKNFGLDDCTLQRCTL